MDTYSSLSIPFPVEKIRWRVGARNQDRTSGIALAYVDARDVMHRLDDIVGPTNWQTEHYPVGNLVACKLGICIDGKWTWKTDGAGETDIEGEKGAFSDSFKRSAVMHGIGRYLYALPNVWVPLKKNGKHLAETPKLPSWATPERYIAILERRNDKSS
jgi:hypothetical protein